MSKKAAKNKVSKKLNLTPLSKKPTMAGYEKRVKELRAMIASGKLRGILLQRAHEYIYSTEHRMRKLKGVSKKINIDQGFLPDFLKSVDMVRIEELLVEKMFNELKRNLQIREVKKSRRAS